MISVCFVAVSSASSPVAALDLDIVFIINNSLITNTSSVTKYDIYNMVYNDFDIITNFENEFLIVLKYEIVIIGSCR